MNVGQLFIIGLSGKTLTQQEQKFLIENDIGGVILFDRNIESPEQVHALCSEIQKLRHKQATQAPLFISIDMEGGRVMRFKAPFTKWPPLARVGDLESTSVAFRFANAMGAELNAVGVNLDFAPCVDVFSNPKNAIIGDRSLSTNAETVAKLASALVRGYIKSAVIPCAKHFPGHGNTLLDSHFDLPVEDIDMKRLQDVELVPFKKVFRSQLEMVMTAHIKFTAIDPEWPITLSEKAIKNFLRKDLRYRNIVISDDLDMKALTKNYDKEKIPVQALKAGCDILLYCNEPDSPPLGLEMIAKALKDKTIDEASITESLKRVEKLKAQHITAPDPLDFEHAKKMIGHPDHIRLAKAIENGSVPADLLIT